MTIAIIVVTVVLLALGIVINQLFRLRDWSKNAPPIELPKDIAGPPDEDSAGPPVV